MLMWLMGTVEQCSAVAHRSILGDDDPLIGTSDKQGAF